MTEDDETIAEFQKRRREFQPLWQRTIGVIFLPGFMGKGFALMRGGPTIS